MARTTIRRLKTKRAKLLDLKHTHNRRSECSRQSSIQTYPVPIFFLVPATVFWQLIIDSLLPSFVSFPSDYMPQ